MKLKKEVERKCREKFKDFSDKALKYVIHSCYLNRIIEGPYLSPNDKSHLEDHCSRKLFKQLFFGNYGPAGIVYSIQGSPPRGIVIVNGGTSILYENFPFKKRYFPVILSSLDFQTSLANYFSDCYGKEVDEFMEKLKESPVLEKEIRKNKQDESA